MRQPGQHPVGFTVLGGFLGAGKTTLLNRLLAAAHGCRLAVLVNDFGAIDIDAELIARHDGETISLSNGCICCSIGDSLLTALLGLAARPEPPDRLIVEASGVADPWKIAQFGLAGQRYRLDGIIVLADAERVMVQADDRYVGDLVRRQLQVADLIVLNKTDRVDADRLQRTAAWIERLQPRARLLPACHADIPPELLLAVPLFTSAVTPAPASPAGHDASGIAGRLQRWSFRSDRPFDEAALAAALDALPASVLRGKGVLRLGDRRDRRTLLQLVGARWQLDDGGDWRTAAAPAASRLVLIGLPGGIDPARLDVLFRSALTD